MLRLEPGLELPPEQRLVLAVDTLDLVEAEEMTHAAKVAGAVAIKLGLELDRYYLPRDYAQLAIGHGLDWIADRKIRATSKTMDLAISNYTDLAHPPLGITVCTESGVEALKIAQRRASEVGMMVFGVGHLSVIDEAEAMSYSSKGSRFIMHSETRRAMDAGVTGFVTSGQELEIVKNKGLFTLVVGTRSQDVIIEGDDQKRPTTIHQAALEGADLIEIGRQVTRHASLKGGKGIEAMSEEMLKVSEEIADGLRVQVA